VGVAVGARLGGILVVWYGGSIEGDVAVGDRGRGLWWWLRYLGLQVMDEVLGGDWR